MRVWSFGCVAVEVSRGEFLTEELDAVHLRLGAAAAVMAFGAALEPVAGWPLTTFARSSGPAA